MLTAEEYRTRAKDHGVSDEQINRVLEQKWGIKPVSALERASNARVNLSQGEMGGPNALGKLVAPRMSDIAQRGQEGGKGYVTNLNELAGVGGELGLLLTAAMARNPRMLGIAGATHGATDPTADLSGRTTGALIEGGLGAATALRHPIRLLGGARSRALGDRSVSTGEFSGGVMQKMIESPWFRQSPVGTRNKALAELENFIDTIGPLEPETMKMGRLGLQSIYKELPVFEKIGKTYVGKGNQAAANAFSEGRRLVSSATRDYTREIAPKSANLITDALRALYGAQNNKFKFGAVAGGLGAAGTALWGINAIKNIPSTIGGGQ